MKQLAIEDQLQGSRTGLIKDKIPLGIEEQFQRSSAGMVKDSCQLRIEKHPVKLEDNGRIKELHESYPDVFGNGVLSPMETEPMVIKWKENYIPKSMKEARNVPYARRNEEIKVIQKIESHWIIESIGDLPT